jgi:hypothetical protein
MDTRLFETLDCEDCKQQFEAQDVKWYWEKPYCHDCWESYFGHEGKGADQKVEVNMMRAAPIEVKGWVSGRAALNETCMFTPSPKQSGGRFTGESYGEARDRKERENTHQQDHCAIIVIRPNITTSRATRARERIQS